MIPVVAGPGLGARLGCVLLLCLTTIATTARADGVKPWAVIQDEAQRFVFYPDQNDSSSSLVLDRATGLIWERTPSTQPLLSVYAEQACLQKLFPADVGGTGGFRVAKAEELSSIGKLVASSSQSVTFLPASSKFNLGLKADYEPFLTPAHSCANGTAPDLCMWVVTFGKWPNNGSISPVRPALVSLVGNLAYRYWCVRGGTN
jgi:hypothetical protein